ENLVHERFEPDSTRARDGGDDRGRRLLSQSRSGIACDRPVSSGERLSRHPGQPRAPLHPGRALLPVARGDPARDLDRHRRCFPSVRARGTGRAGDTRAWSRILFHATGCRRSGIGREARGRGDPGRDGSVHLDRTGAADRLGRWNSEVARSVELLIPDEPGRGVTFAMQKSTKQALSFSVLIAGAVIFGMVVAGAVNVTPRTEAQREAPVAKPRSSSVTVPSFADIADGAMPSVVSITSTETVKGSARRFSSPFGNGEDPFEFFFGQPRDRRGRPRDDDEHREQQSGTGFLISD